MMNGAADLAERSSAFAEDVQKLLDAVLPGTRRIVSVEYDHRFIVRPDGDLSKDQLIPLYVDDQEFAALSLVRECGVDAVAGAPTACSRDQTPAEQPEPAPAHHDGDPLDESYPRVVGLPGGAEA